MDGPYFISLKSGVQRIYCDQTTNEGGWTLFLRAARGTEAGYLTSNKQYGSDSSGTWIFIPGSAYNTNGGNGLWKMKAEDINGIRESYKDWGDSLGYSPSADSKTYWMHTPQSGTSNTQMGAESYHRQDCVYVANRNSGSIKGSQCHWNTWEYNQGSWYSGGHWWDNSGCYQ